MLPGESPTKVVAFHISQNMVAEFQGRVYQKRAEWKWHCQLWEMIGRIY